MSKPIELSEIQCQRWMERLLSRATKVGLLGEIPVSAVILDQNGHCIGYGSNKREREKDPLGHAELVALRQASLIKNDWRFNECTMIVTLEPCPMCAGALIQARMGQLIYGASDSKRGAFDGSLDLSTHKSAHHHMHIRRGVMAKEASDLLESWFKLLRQNCL